MASRQKVSVLLVDRHAVVREGYRRLLEKKPDIAVVGEAADAAEAHAQFRRLAPRVVVMDISLPGASGIEAMRRILSMRPSTRVLIFSMYEEAIYARRSLEAGAAGYVTKTSQPKELVEAVQTIAKGRMYVSAEIAHALERQKIAEDQVASGGLSARQLQVLRLLLEGRGIRAIADATGLSPKTVSNHQSAIKQKLGVQTGVQLVRIGSTLLEHAKRKA